MSLDAIREQALDHWAPQPGEIAGEGLEESLEAGKVLYFPRLRFSFDGDEQRFLSEQWADGKAKNISFRGVNKPLQGAQGSAVRGIGTGNIGEVNSDTGNRNSSIVQFCFNRVQVCCGNKLRINAYRSGILS